MIQSRLSGFPPVLASLFEHRTKGGDDAMLLGPSSGGDTCAVRGWGWAGARLRTEGREPVAGTRGQRGPDRPHGAPVTLRIELQIQRDGFGGALGD